MAQSLNDCVVTRPDGSTLEGESLKMHLNSLKNTNDD